MVHVLDPLSRDIWGMGNLFQDYSILESAVSTTILGEKRSGRETHQKYLFTVRRQEISISYCIWKIGMIHKPSGCLIRDRIRSSDVLLHHLNWFTHVNFKIYTIMDGTLSNEIEIYSDKWMVTGLINRVGMWICVC